MASIPLPPDAKNMVVAALKERTPKLYRAMQEDGTLTDVVDLYATALRERMIDLWEPPKNPPGMPFLAAIRQQQEALTYAVETVQVEMLSTEALHRAFNQTGRTTPPAR